MLFFPGGHCSAAVDCGWSLYTSIGHGVLAFSRPGFVNDLHQARSDRGAYRRASQATVRCPTLVTASRDDAAVAFAHAEDFAHTIPTATLVELRAPSHLFRIGPARDQAHEAVGAFITATG